MAFSGFSRIRLPVALADLGIEFGGGAKFPFRPWVNSRGVVGGVFPARFRGGVVDEVPWIRGG